jgi:hypothetical protein
MSITAMKQALEALVEYKQYIQPLTDYFGGPKVPKEGSTSAKVNAAITSLREAIEQAEQAQQWQSTADKVQLKKEPAKGGLLPEQAQPMAKREPEIAIGLDAIHKLQQPIAQERQPQPVAWKDKTYGNLHHQNYGNSIPLYTAPPPRQPLTDEEIDKLPWEPHEGNPMTFAEGLRYFARAIEAAHGITQGQPVADGHVTDGTKCWCEPELDYKDPDTGAEVWIHRGKQ